MVIATGFEPKNVTGYDNARLTPELYQTLQLVLQDKTILISLNKEELVYVINTHLPDNLKISKALFDRFVNDAANFETKLIPLYTDIRNLIIEAKCIVKQGLTKTYLDTKNFAEMRKFEFIMDRKFKDWVDVNETEAAKVPVGNKYIINIQNNNPIAPITSEEQMIELNNNV